MHPLKTVHVMRFCTNNRMEDCSIINILSHMKIFGIGESAKIGHLKKRQIQNEIFAGKNFKDNLLYPVISFI